jgi:hypothetical protein
VLDLCNLRQSEVVRFCEHGNNLSGFLKDGEFLDQLGKYHFLKAFVLRSWSLLPPIAIADQSLVND